LKEVLGEKKGVFMDLLSNGSLCLSDYGLSILPDELEVLKGVRHVILSGNRLTRLPAYFFTNLKFLETMNLSGNKLEHIPPGLTSQLTTLKTLDVSHNQIREITPDISQLVNLTVLRIHGNRIVILPLEVSKLSKLNELTLDISKMKTPPSDLCRSVYDASAASERGGDILREVGIKQIFRFLQKINKEKPHHAVKVLLLGQENVGKSSLVKALKRAKCISSAKPAGLNRERTTVDVHAASSYKLMVHNLDAKVKEGTSEEYHSIRFSCWDFSGQVRFLLDQFCCNDQYNHSSRRFITTPINSFWREKRGYI